MNRNENGGEWENPAGEDRNPGYQASENAKTIMIALFVISLIVFFIQYRKVYGEPGRP